MAILLALVGCGGEEAARRPVYPVEGRLLVNELPAANAQIAFHVQSAGGSVVRPVATTGPDGTFRVTTYASGDGAPAGEYAVTVVWPSDALPNDECVEATAHDRLNGFYADPAARRLVVTIAPGPNALTLQATAGSKGWALPKRSN